MPPAPLYVDAISEALRGWRQGDLVLESDLAFVHIARLSQPLTEPAIQAAAQEPPFGEDSDLASVFTDVPGFVVLTQTCDIIRSCQIRPYVELAPLIEVADERELENIRRLKRPSFAYLPILAERRLVADLDRTFTIEKAVLAPLKRTTGFITPQDAIEFAEALARKRRRFAFPDDLDLALKKFSRRFEDRARKNSEEGHHVDAIREIRVAASPSWEAESVGLTFWFIKERDPEPTKWLQFLREWQDLINQSGRYKLTNPFHLVRLEDLTAKDYLDSQRLDFDRLSSA